jgi:hypothetical protein
MVRAASGFGVFGVDLLAEAVDVTGEDLVAA